MKIIVNINNSYCNNIIPALNIDSQTIIAESKNYYVVLQIENVEVMIHSNGSFNFKKEIVPENIESEIQLILKLFEKISRPPLDMPWTIKVVIPNQQKEVVLETLTQRIQRRIVVTENKELIYLEMGTELFFSV